MGCSEYVIFLVSSRCGVQNDGFCGIFQKARKGGALLERIKN